MQVGACLSPGTWGSQGKDGTENRSPSAVRRTDTLKSGHQWPIGQYPGSPLHKPNPLTEPYTASLLHEDTKIEQILKENLQSKRIFLYM
jgi:hypothetical protein